MTTNPLLSKIQLPGETFQLPSQGIFYVNGELDESVKNGEVEVYPLKTIDEIVFNTPDKLLNGKSIVEVFGRCIPQILQPMKLLAKDVDFLLVCLRMVTYGRDMEIHYEHTCENSKDHTYNVNLQHIISSTQKFDPTSIESEYQLILPNQQVIQLHPMIYDDVIRLYDIQTVKKNKEMSDEELEDMLIKTMMGIIYSVDGIVDSELIYPWLKQLHLGYKKLIENKIRLTTDWGVKYDTYHTCKDCNDDIIIKITANPIDFFFQQ